MKAFVFFAAFVAVWPFSLFLRGNSWCRQNIWIVLGLLPFLGNALPFTHASIVSVEWNGYATGVEVQALDLIALAVLFFHKEPNPAFRHLPFLFYSSMVALSLLQADNTLTSFFGVWQIYKGYFVAFVVARGAMREGVARKIIIGMVIGASMQVVFVLLQKVLHGVPQPTGTFTHQNELGISMHFVLYPALTILMSGFPGIIWSVGVVSVVFIVALIASRATAGLAAFGMFLTMLYNAWWNMTMRKGLMIIGSVFMVAIIVPVAYSSFKARLSTTPLQEDLYNERQAFNRAAAAMLSDHPFGVGANQYSYTARAYGYSLRAGVAPFEGNLAAIVHNAYRLMAAETGYLGVLGFVLFLLVPLTTALRLGLRYRTTPDGALLGTLGISLAVVCIHSNFEWILFWPTPFYLLTLTQGMIYGLAWRVTHAPQAQTTQAAAAASGLFSYPAGRLVKRASRPLL